MSAIRAEVLVQVMNHLDNGHCMNVHCQSKDDDLGLHLVEDGDDTTWSFDVNFWGTTLFYCDVQWDDSKWHHFDAYDAKRDYRRFETAAKFKGNYLKKVLESVTQVSDIDAVIEQADEAHRLFSGTKPVANLINLDSASSTSQMTPGERREQLKNEAALHASSLRVPCRSPWNAKMSAQELDANERQAFLSRGRRLARHFVFIIAN
ncbi:unnamed protein product [Fraxinus pennsylvanica]|uniref:S-protein homolog n=1 Tax=Fraxinus pennsylvanica TaxID=56036 RepID=A0AAD2DYL3_9LAMI|nr:unnamed protein product [Fraxinus pennsylvanica]